MWLFILQRIGWAICIVYASIPLFWLLIHPHVNYWRSRPGSPYRVLLPLWLAMWVSLGLVTARWRGLSFYSTAWTWIPALVLFASGLLIYKSSRKYFSGTQLSGLAELLPAQHEQKLVTSGIRARIRHPVYLGHLCEMLAWSVGSGLAVCYGLTAFAIVTGVVMMRFEDAELQQRFGEAYTDYRRRVPAVIPSMRI